MQRSPITILPRTILTPDGLIAALPLAAPPEPLFLGVLLEATNCTLVHEALYWLCPKPALCKGPENVLALADHTGQMAGLYTLFAWRN